MVHEDFKIAWGSYVTINDLIVFYVVFFGNTLIVGRERNSSFEIEDDTGLNGEWDSENREDNQQSDLTNNPCHQHVFCCLVKWICLCEAICSCLDL